MGFFKLLTGIVTGIAAFGGSILHQAAPRSDRAPAPRIEPSIIEAAPDSTSSIPVQPRAMLFQADALATPASSTVPAKKEEFALGTITEIASSTVTIQQDGVARVITLVPNTHVNARIILGEAVIIVGIVDTKGNMTAISIEERNPAQKGEQLPDSIGE